MPRHVVSRFQIVENSKSVAVRQWCNSSPRRPLKTWSGSPEFKSHGSDSPVQITQVFVFILVKYCQNFKPVCREFWFCVGCILVLISLPVFFSFASWPPFIMFACWIALPAFELICLDYLSPFSCLLIWICLPVWLNTGFEMLSFPVFFCFLFFGRNLLASLTLCLAVFWFKHHINIVWQKDRSS